MFSRKQVCHVTMRRKQKYQVTDVGVQMSHVSYLNEFRMN